MMTAEVSFFDFKILRITRSKRNQVDLPMSAEAADKDDKSVKMHTRISAAMTINLRFLI